MLKAIKSGSRKMIFFIEQNNEYLPNIFYFLQVKGSNKPLSPIYLLRTEMRGM
jgi:hypothetical protein